MNAAGPDLGRPAVVVTPMRRRHLPGVLAIESRVYPRPWSSKLFEDELERRGRCYLVARQGEAVVGYAGLLMIADDGHVSTVAVDPGVQGRSIATRLLVELVRCSLELGARQLTLEVRASNERAQRIYGRLGFAPVGARKAYYGDNGEDAVVMWAHDITTDAYAARLDAIEAELGAATVRSGLDVATHAPPVHPAAARSGAGGGRMGSA
ncbi:MAG: ribosomal protein S18-alanine N-acetyltransferase [Actinobacteria bacterium]|nr:ribosomal protein S18-alanine N-acetyltransferase [Actinomycetota bacterium]